MSILSAFDLKGTQLDAASRLDTHLAVTAGAGSGKTRALVARYLNFVEQGVPVRSLVAITFTEKAAREMKSRIRHEIENWLANSPLPQGEPRERGASHGPGVRADSPLPSAQFATGAPGGRVGGEDLWQTAFIELDSARIGTIHALCADLLRLHPAEAGVDPRFDVLDEAIAATLQAQAIETALAWAANDAGAVRLFAAFKENELRNVLSALFAARLDARTALDPSDPLASWAGELKRWLDEKLSSPEWVAALATLSEYTSPVAADKLELARREVLARWDEAQAARRRSPEQSEGDAAGDWDEVFDALRELRGAISTAGQKASWDVAALDAVRGAMKTLRGYYDETIKPLTKDECRWELDRHAAELLLPLSRLFDRALADYQSLKDDRRALDFDDLESLAARLLTIGNPTPLRFGDYSQQSAISNLRAVLVDEFQDTNDRQRRIVYALTGFEARQTDNGKTNSSRHPSPVTRHAEAANLFIVGDPKQSIYRFRGADVTVFRNIQSDIAKGGGELIDLDLTFRAHAPLLDLLNRLLAPLMGEADQPDRPYRVPFAPLTAYRQQPRESTREPFVEFHLGLGDNADAGRQAAAVALSVRLHELHEREGFAWEHIALLFRASTAFPVYEDALEDAGIPFVTVAGKGFYDRPEIRDLLNALAAIADPTDDLALAGLLRSPAFGLTDADLFHLRFPNGGDDPQPLWQSFSLPSPVGAFPTGHPEGGPGVKAIIATLHALAGRLPVAELLKRFLDLTNYRAILKAADGKQRLSRNVDKLLADAHRSRLVSVGDFLEYVQSLRDVGAREGEAPAEVGGAVQLMTVHKAKGLEFPLVVIADAGYDHTGSNASIRLDPDLGVLLKVETSRRSETPHQGVSTGDKARPFSWQLGALFDADREDAEDRRLLYVAVTRAKEKVIVSGHAKVSTAKDDPGRLRLSGWLARLALTIGLDEAYLPQGEIRGPVALQPAPDWAATVTATLHPLPA
ncbi:MAG: UvrD-helicase domain-containing protein, partial [Chloroflexi bacterium]|nr:UvrD-helicase domain-containing protein [Chloroflexota bacterium]